MYFFLWDIYPLADLWVEPGMNWGNISVGHRHSPSKRPRAILFINGPVLNIYVFVF